MGALMAMIKEEDGLKDVITAIEQLARIKAHALTKQLLLKSQKKLHDLSV